MLLHLFGSSSLCVRMCEEIKCDANAEVWMQGGS